ncbi:N-acetylmuramoyl-L-alanine amidase [Streptococcus hongkongensis]|nr:N-acetylmuramoyl-L-alanine amidase [Streptococcus uberis]
MKKSSQSKPYFLFAGAILTSFIVAHTTSVSADTSYSTTQPLVASNSTSQVQLANNGSSNITSTTTGVSSLQSEATSGHTQSPSSTVNEATLVTDSSTPQEKSSVGSTTLGQANQVSIATSQYNTLALSSTSPVVMTKPVVNYSSHVKNIGWQAPVTDSMTSGTTGKALQVEAINISLDQLTYGNISYSTFVTGKGWQVPSTAGQINGTTGQARAIQAIQLNLTGELASYYDIYYRAHISDYGWLDWAKNGQKAGSEGLSANLEAYEVKILEKTTAVILPSKNYFISNSKPILSYQTHVETIGWQTPVSEGQLAGTTGQAKQVEAIKFFLDTTEYGDILYRAHVQNEGWQNYVSSGSLSGTTGKAEQIEAIQIKLTGSLADRYSVKYRVHVQDIGWQTWVYDDNVAGTVGLSKQIEAIEVYLVDRVTKPVGLSASQGNYSVINKVIYLDAGHGGYDPGASYFNQNEKTLNLQMQSLVKSKLEAAGYKVVTTRTEDTFVDLLPRSEKANQSLADIFVSIHFNASPSSAANGIETYYYEYYEDYPSRINDSYHNDPECLSRSSDLANAIQIATVLKTGAKNNGVLRNTFAVLRETTAPAVLLELGYMSNQTEFQRINASAYQEKLAQGVVSGILSYYKTYSV